MSVAYHPDSVTLKVLLVDDEPPARTRILRFFEEMPGYSVVGEAETGIEALEKINKLQPDVIILDIRMPQMNGLEVAQHLTQLENPPAVIFATAYDEYALQAFESNAVGYLLKPVRKEKLVAALEKAHKLTRVQLESLNTEAQPKPLQRTHFWVRLGDEVELIPVNEIIFLLAEQKYVKIIHEKGETLIDEPLKKIQAEFGDRFLRIHRSSLVAIDRISKLTTHKDGRVFVEVTDWPEPLEVSRRAMARVRTSLREYASRVRKR